MAMRIRKVASVADMDRTVDDFITQGFKIKSQGEKSTLLAKGGYGSGAGHLIVFLLTAWWTFGIGNLVYAVLAKLGGEQITVKVE